MKKGTMTQQRIARHLCLPALFALFFVLSAFFDPRPSCASAAEGLIGCDADVNEQTVDRVDALTQQQIEASNAMITQPTPVEQLSCFDQTTEIFSELGGIHSNPQEDIGFSINPNVQLPLKNFLDQFLNNNIMGGVNDFINQAFNNVTQKFASLFGSVGGGLFTAGPASNCDMQQQAWLISQCIEMPTIPSLGDILGGQIGELMGTINDLANPQRLIEQVCSAANKQIQGYFGDLNETFNRAAESSFSPITDRVN